MTGGCAKGPMPNDQGPNKSQYPTHVHSLGFEFWIFLGPWSLVIGNYPTVDWIAWHDSALHCRQEVWCYDDSACFVRFRSVSPGGWEADGACQVCRGCESFFMTRIEFCGGRSIVRSIEKSPNMSNSTDAQQPWDIQLARGMYHIQRWGAKYFDINEAGHVVAMPQQEAGASVDITDVIEEAKGRGLRFPLLIRFQDILRHRVESINLAFRSSIAEFNYQGSYQGVFPIKVNQLREVVAEILDAGKPFNFGLEVGSKPELFAGLAMQGHQGCLIICNGYKDAGFIKMAVLGLKLGKKVIMVVEKLEELRHIISLSKQLGVEPLIGIRARLLSKGAGKWAESGGENAKFGLSTAELLAATEMLKAENLGHCFKLLHFHIGSQVPDILTVKKAVQEASRFYAKLYKMGFAIEYMDVGGGLGVDYDGSRSAFDSSTNYTLQEYTNDIVYYIADRVTNAEKRCRIRTSSARAVGRLWPITACWWWRCLGR